MNSIRTHILLAQVRLAVRYVVVSRRCGDMAGHLIHEWLEDFLYTGCVPYTRRANDGVLGRPQAQDLSDDGIPLLLERLHGCAQTLLIVASTAGSALVRFARLSEVVDAYVEGYDLGGAKGSAHLRVVA